MKLRFAVPLLGGEPAPELHKCSDIAVVDVHDGRFQKMDTTGIEVTDPEELVRKLTDMGINILIAGCVRRHILDKLNLSGINLVTGACGDSVKGLVIDFLNGSLKTKPVAPET